MLIIGKSFIEYSNVLCCEKSISLKVMKFLKDNHPGSFEFQKASDLVKENLSKTINFKKI